MRVLTSHHKVSLWQELLAAPLRDFLSSTLFTTWKTTLMLTSRETSFKAMLGENTFLIYEINLIS